MHPRPRETKLAAKKNRILNEVFRSESVSRFDLARRLNINATMVGTYVDEFLRTGILVEGEPVQSRPGRAPVPLHPNPDYGCFLGLDFEALRARAVLCDFAGDVLEKEEVAIRPGSSREVVLERIVALADKLAGRADRPLLSVGVAAPGQVDVIAGRVLHYRLLPDFDQVPVRERFEAVFDTHVFLEDNIRAVACAELMRGSGRGSRNYLCLAIRSGVGLGIIIDGKLYTGTNMMAGEVAYTVMSTQDGRQITSDLVAAKGFVESTRKVLASWQGNRVREELLEKGEDLSLTDIVVAAEEGDQLLRSRLEELGNNLGMLAANLANLFAPEKIVLAGEVSNCSRLVRQSMERSFREYTLPQILRTVYLEDGTLGVFAGALGAAWLGFTKVFPEEEEVLVRQVKERRRRAQPA